MIWRVATALLLPLCIGLLTTWRLTRRVQIRDHTSQAWHLVRIMLAIGIGLGLTSLFFFLFLVLYGQASRWLIPAEAVVMGLLLLLARSQIAGKMRAHPWSSDGNRSRLNVTGWLFYGILALSVLAFVFRSLNHPHGGWDAWAMWNLRARFLFDGGLLWDRGFAEQLGWSNADYPLLLPASTARLWTYLGTDALAAPALIALLFTFATVGLLTAALVVLRGPTQAYLGGLLLLATAYFIRHGAAQYADVPFGFFFLATFVLLVLYAEAPSTPPGLLYLAGLTAGLSAWTKNEGVLFLLALVLSRLLVALFRRSSRSTLCSEIRAFLLPLAPILIVLAFFKLQYATPNWLTSGMAMQEATSQLTDVSRSVAIGTSFARLAFRHDGLIALLLLLYAGLLGLQPATLKDNWILTALAVVTLMLLGYGLVFLFSPFDLAWHLRVALKRLLLQLWPACLFLAMLIINTPEDISRKHQT